MKRIVQRFAELLIQRVYTPPRLAQPESAYEILESQMIFLIDHHSERFGLGQKQGGMRPGFTLVHTNELLTDQMAFQEQLSLCFCQLVYDQLPRVTEQRGSCGCLACEIEHPLPIRFRRASGERHLTKIARKPYPRGQNDVG